MCCCSGADGPILEQLQYPYMCDVDNLFAPYGGPTKVRCRVVDAHVVSPAVVIVVCTRP